MQVKVCYTGMAGGSHCQETPWQTGILALAVPHMQPGLRVLQLTGLPAQIAPGCTWGLVGARSPNSCWALVPSYMWVAARTMSPISCGALSSSCMWRTVGTWRPVSCRSLDPGCEWGAVRTESPMWGEGFNHSQAWGMTAAVIPRAQGFHVRQGTLLWLGASSAEELATGVILLHMQIKDGQQSAINKDLLN